MPFFANEKLKANRYYPKTVKDWIIFSFFFRESENSTLVVVLERKIVQSESSAGSVFSSGLVCTRKHRPMSGECVRRIWMLQAAQLHRQVP